MKPLLREIFLCALAGTGLGVGAHGLSNVVAGRATESEGMAEIYKMCPDGPYIGRCWPRNVNPVAEIADNAALRQRVGLGEAGAGAALTLAAALIAARRKPG